jgi:hypothetical protein
MREEGATPECRSNGSPDDPDTRDVEEGHPPEREGVTMGTPIYQHWVGKMVVKAGVLPAATHPVDTWFPAEKPAGATRIARDTYPVPANLFADVIHLRGKVGPVNFRIKVDLAFQGTVEHWQAPAPGERARPAAGSPLESG